MRSTVNSVVNTISSKVNSMKSKISSAVSGAVSAIKGAASRMYSAGANLVGNLINGVVSKIAQFKNKISELANTAKQFLGFSSPTEKGPGRTAHKWIPNLIGMMSKQLNNGVSEFSKGGSRLAAAIQQSTTSTMSNSILSSTNRASNITNLGNSRPITININATNHTIDQIGSMLVSRFRSYGIKSQME
jgi:phage-related protein